MKNLLYILLFSLSLLSCKTQKADNDGALIGYNYYPIKTGNTYIYKVVDTVYNDVNVFKDTVYYIKDVIGDPYTFGDEIRYSLNRYYSSTETFNVSPDSVWTVFNDNSKIIYTRNNYRYIRLSFPLELNKEWNGNTLNVFEEQTYRIDAYQTSFSTSIATYPSIVSVLQNDNKNYVDQKYEKEIFAENIGLVYYQLTDVEFLYASNQSADKDLYEIKLGKKRTMELIRYELP